MATYKICDIGFAPDASHALHSMFKIMEGRAQASWIPAALDAADVLLANVTADPLALSAWSRSGKPVIFVIDERGSFPPAPFVLRHPVRVMQLLSMLDNVTEHLREPRRQPSATSDGTSAWRVAESLRAVAMHTVERGWNVAEDAEGAHVWVGGGHAHALPATLAALREGRLALGTFQPTTDWPAGGAERLPVRDLAWYIGLGGDESLAPWLDAGAAFRLRRWPDFGRLGARVELLELAAHAAARPCTPALLASGSGQPIATVNRFLAAASMAGLLVAVPRVEAVPAPSVAAASPARGWRRFVGDLRKHLGLVA